MKVLVIGGTRYMGRIAVRQLLGEGDQVAVFTRGNTRPDWWSEIEHIPGDDSKGYEHRAHELSLAADWRHAHDDCVSRLV